MRLHWNLRTIPYSVFDAINESHFSDSAWDLQIYPVYH